MPKWQEHQLAKCQDAEMAKGQVATTSAENQDKDITNSEMPKRRNHEHAQCQKAKMAKRQDYRTNNHRHAQFIEKWQGKVCQFMMY